MRHLPLSLLLGALVACSAAAPDTHAPPAAPPPAPAWTMPEVQGLHALEDTNPDPNVVEVSLTAGRTAHSFLSGTTAPVYAYNGSIPGPLLRAKVGDRVIVHFKNDLPEPTTIHWHGLRIPDQMDGSPRVHDPVKPGAEFTYDFTVPDAGSYWYHPHVQAPVQVEMGLYAPIVIFDPKRDPTYDAERFLVLDDIRIEKNGKVSPESSMDGMMGGRFGNVLLTNGKPAKEATASAEQGTIERWRIVNSANARTMQIGLEGATFRVIATDGGLLPEPYATKRLVVAIGQRFDLEVTYDRPGTAKLLSFVETDEGEAALPAFAVDVAASERVPREIVWPSVTLVDRAADATATMILDANEKGDMPWTMNGKSDPIDPLFTWKQGATVDMTIVNRVETEHPFHLHGQFFRILDDKQPGLKDVVLVPPKGNVRIRAFLDNPGRWMAHCHILEHAEMGMMAEVVVTATGVNEPLPSAGH